MNRRSPFADEWRSCLREHYKETVRANDRQTLETLGAIMFNVGFGEDELRTLMIEATIRADETPDGFVPPLDLLAQPPANRHPAECACPQCVEVNVVPHDAEGQPLRGDALREEAERAAWARGDDADDSSDDGEADEPPASTVDPDGYKQMSLFGD